MEIEKKLCQRIALVKRVTFVEWKSALKKEGKRNFESKYHDVKVKSLEQRSTLMCIFSYVEEKKRVKSKFIKFTKCVTIIK